MAAKSATHQVYQPEEIHIWDIAAPILGNQAHVASASQGRKTPTTNGIQPGWTLLLLQRMEHPISEGKTVLFLGAAMETWPTEMKGGERAMRLIDLHSAADAEPRIVAAEQSIITTAFSPDGHWLATGHEDFSVGSGLPSEGPEFKSWDLGRVNFLQGFFAEFSPQSGYGHYLYVGGRLWEVNGPPEKIAGTGRWIDSSGKLAGKPVFDPQAHWLVEPHGHEIRVWNLAHLAAHAPIVLTGHEGDVDKISFTADGKWMISKTTSAGFENSITADKPVARETASDRANRLNLESSSRVCGILRNWNLMKGEFWRNSIRSIRCR